MRCHPALLAAVAFGERVIIDWTRSSNGRRVDAMQLHYPGNIEQDKGPVLDHHRVHGLMKPTREKMHTH